MNKNAPLKPLGDKKRTNIKRVVAVFSVMCMVMLLVSAFPTVFAAANSDAGRKVIELIIDIVKYICSIVGILLAILGTVKLILAHNEGDGPAQQKAGITLAVGVILVAIGVSGFLNLFKDLVPDLPDSVN